MGWINSLRSKVTGRVEAAPPARISRAPRVRILPLHRVYFLREAPPWSAPILVANLSVTGMALVADSQVEWPAVGETVQGQLMIGHGSHERGPEPGQQHLPVSARVVRLAPVTVGLHFLEPPTALTEVLKTYFRVESAANRLHALNPETLEANPEGKPYCFVGENNTQLYYTERDGRLTSFELSFFGNHIEAYAGKSLRFGSLSYDEVTDQAKFKGSTLVFPAAPFSEELCQEAVRFVENIEMIDVRIRGLITAAILSGRL